MLWSFIAVCLSGWLYVDASYRGPVWQRWVFKPVTLILLLLLAWQAPMFNAISYLVLAGLCASLIGDALTLLPTPVRSGTGLNVQNLAYAAQWWIFGGFAIFLWLRMVRDEATGDQAD